MTCLSLGNTEESSQSKCLKLKKVRALFFLPHFIALEYSTSVSVKMIENDKSEGTLFKEIKEGVICALIYGVAYSIIRFRFNQNQIIFLISGLLHKILAGYY